MTHGNEKSSATKKIASSRLDPRRRGCERLLGESRFERLLNSWGTRCWSSVNFFSMVMLQLQSSILQDHIYPYSSIFVHIHPYSSIFYIFSWRCFCSPAVHLEVTSWFASLGRELQHPQRHPKTSQELSCFADRTVPRAERSLPSGKLT